MSKKTNAIIVRGQNVTSSTFTRDYSSIKSAAAKLGRLLEAAGKQAAIFDNLDWINRIFDAESPLVKKDGELSEQGKKAKAYITFHVPAVKIEKDEQSGVIKASFTKNKKNRGLFVASTDDEGTPVMSDDGAADFKFTFEEWNNRAKKKAPPKAPKANKTTTALEKALEEWADLEGSADDFFALEQAARRIMEAANARKAALVAELASEVDENLAAQLENIKPQSSGRADTDREEHAEADAA